MTTKPPRLPKSKQNFVGNEKTAAAMRAAKVGKPSKVARKDEHGLTEVQRLFVLYFIGEARQNSTEAAWMMGQYTTRKSASQAGHRFMRYPEVAAEVKRLTDERNKRLEYTADDVLRDTLSIKRDADFMFAGPKGKTVGLLRTRLDIVKTAGDHVNVAAFRRQVGLSGPGGGPIEVVTAGLLAKLTDEELDIVERALAIINRYSPAAEPADAGADQGGAATASEDD